MTEEEFDISNDNYEYDREDSNEDVYDGISSEQESLFEEMPEYEEFIVDPDFYDDSYDNFDSDNQEEEWEEDFDEDEYDGFDDEEDFDEDDILSVNDIDFSDFKGNRKKDLKALKRTTSGKKIVPRKVQKKIKVNETKGRIKHPEIGHGNIKKKPLEKGIKPRPKASNPSPKKPIDIQKEQVKKMIEKNHPKPVLKNKPTINPRTGKPVGRPRIERKTATPAVQQQFPRKRPVRKPLIVNGKVRERIEVPRNRKVIVEGIDKFILSDNEPAKNIGYYKGEKLRELVFVINNTTPNELNIELFNPSEPLDYFMSTSQNLNDLILVAGANKISYSDMLFNILANPVFLPNAKFTATGVNAQQQFSQGLFFKNKNIAGVEKIAPIQNTLNFDILQQQRQIIYWDILKTLGRAFIPDGMDVIQYKVLPFTSVVFGFYYKQVSLKKFFWKEARDKRIL